MVLIEGMEPLDIAREVEVSVPLRGLWFLSVNRFKLIKRECEKVSVPLRGLWFLLHGSPRHAQLASGRFRPLAGIMVLIDAGLAVAVGDFHIVRFRPLAGIMVLIAPFINAFMKPSKWHFAGRIIYFHHFLSFAGK